MRKTKKKSTKGPANEDEKKKKKMCQAGSTNTIRLETIKERGGNVYEYFDSGRSSGCWICMPC